MTPRTLALLLAAVLIGAVAFRDRTATEAAQRDATTWGAAEPSWSPDGKRLAFTLAGSIWTVPAAGGEAEQLSSGPGYHAHPAWSPGGEWIAYIDGPPPAGLLPAIRGKLMLVNAGSGQQRAVALPHPTAGTPSWSPDGATIAVPLMTPDAGAQIHRVEVAGGEARRLQQRTQRGPLGNWFYTAWAPGPEIVWTGQQFASVQNGSQILGAPQVWSMAAAPGPIAIQSPLTSYRLADIAQLHKPSTLANGDVVYAGVLVNGKGDRELYRVARGAKPVTITNTPRDEFSPAVSPDGRTIAFDSNRLGNLDLFTMPIGGGEPNHVRITGLRFRGAQARLRLAVRDETGQPARVRMFVSATDGKAYGPAGAPLFYYNLDPGQPREGFFLTSGDDEIVLPAGRVKLVAVKGIEYRIEERQLELAGGDTSAVTIALTRWTNWNQKGWYTGENHFHANYNGSYYQRPPDSLDWLEAEDLNTANMIVANSEGAFIHDKEFFQGRPDPASKPRFILYWGQEYRNSDPLGHMAFLNIRRQVPPSFTSVVGSRSRWDYPLNTMAALEARRQGGLVVYVHPMSGTLSDPMDTNLGAKEAPLTAALGAMDAIDILPYGPAAYELWYRLLNSGFRIAPGAGTDVFTNWRGINRIPGLSRQYVDTGSAFTWERWIERYRAGRAFVTNGPLVAFDVNGQPMGSVIPASTAPYRAKVSAEVNARTPVDTVELVRNGQVIETWKLPAGTNSHRVEKEVEVERSAWLAVRVSGPAARGLGNEPMRAHSAPVWIEVARQPVLVREDLELMIRWLDRLWMNLESRDNFGPGDNRAKARAMWERGVAHYRAKLGQAR
ncbi:MAG: CehA/McbA family metallohydrolase [Bryobacteraceae bacterium]